MRSSRRPQVRISFAKRHWQSWCQSQLSARRTTTSTPWTRREAFVFDHVTDKPRNLSRLLYLHSPLVAYGQEIHHQQRGCCYSNGLRGTHTNSYCGSMHVDQEALPGGPLLTAKGLLVLRLGPPPSSSFRTTANMPHIASRFNPGRRLIA